MSTGRKKYCNDSYFRLIVSPLIIGVLILFYTDFLLLAKSTPFSWRTATPESQGMSSEKLQSLKDDLQSKQTKALLIVRGDKIVFEWYAQDHGKDIRHYTASLAKALVGGLSLLLALDDGIVDADAPACRYIPQWQKDEVRSKITIRQLATHTSGIEDAELSDAESEALRAKGMTLTDRHMSLPGWKGAFWRREPDPFSVVLDQAPILFTPGTEYAYSNPGMAMLSYAITSAYGEHGGFDVRTLLRERIFDPIGLNDEDWSIGYGETYDVDGLKLVANWGGGAFTARAVARVGQLMLNRGNWQGKQLIDSVWVDRALRYAGMPLPHRQTDGPVPASGLGWYTNFDAVWRFVPRDAFAGAGAGNQVLLVVPSLDLIVVRNGGDLYQSSKGETFWGGLEQHLFTPVLDAIEQPPYPPSDQIELTEFAPLSFIIRRAAGSDNWPITWADDDNLYTAYGDGWGFEPKTEIKLSLGLARISGSPPDFSGVNIRSVSGERVGQGEHGPKASGILMIDGILYLLVRNTDIAQLAWSQDHGKTWEWSDWKFENGFGCPTFLNFKENYRGARDDYVYIYSHDENSAYRPSDRMVLARVHKNELRNRRAYEFFTGRDERGQAKWSVDIHNREAVFTHPGRCYRSSVSYNAGLGRYLWCQIIPGGDTRFEGGFAIYEGEEPWGPWFTVFYTRKWDTGPGDTCSLPTKWMSGDGTTCYLVFSGDDSFSVRRLEFAKTSDGPAIPNDHSEMEKIPR